MSGQIEQLEQGIARQREELGENLETLATKARTMTDWRAQFDAHPLVAIGLAASGGAILAAMLTPSRRPREASEPGEARRPAPKSGAGHLIGDIGTALGAVASATAVDLLTEAIPGFRSHFRKGAKDSEG